MFLSLARDAQGRNQDGHDSYKILYRDCTTFPSHWHHLASFPPLPRHRIHGSLIDEMSRSRISSFGAKVLFIFSPPQLDSVFLINAASAKLEVTLHGQMSNMLHWRKLRQCLCRRQEPP